MYIGLIVLITVLLIFVFKGKNKNTPWQTPEDESTMNDPG